MVDKTSKTPTSTKAKTATSEMKKYSCITDSPNAKANQVLGDYIGPR
jgi:hypothetical protein